MRKVYKVPLAIRAATQPGRMLIIMTLKNIITFLKLKLLGLLETLQNNNVLLEQIQKCLDAYLESKRAIFPRL